MTADSLLFPEEVDGEERPVDSKGADALSGHIGAAARWLHSPAALCAMSWDEAHRREPAQVRLAVAVVADSPEAGRATVAVQLLDREFRRCAAAWSVKDPRVIGLVAQADTLAPDVWLDRLVDYPTPADLGQHGSTIAAALGPPLAMLLSPGELVAAGLRRWPLTTLSYAASGFGTDYSLTVHGDAALEPARYARDAGDLLAVLDETSQGQWRGSSTGAVYPWERVKHRGFRYRAIGTGPTSAGRVRVVLMRTDGRREDVFLASLA